MKKLKYVPIKGRGDKDLFVRPDEPLTTYSLFILAANLGPVTPEGNREKRSEVETIIWRKLDKKALDVLEPAEERKLEFVILDDDVFDIMRPQVDRIIRGYSIHSGYVEDAVNGAVSEYTPPAAPPVEEKKAQG